jgi:hypothetical protein
MTDPNKPSVFDALLHDLGPDPDTALSEDELNTILGGTGPIVEAPASATTIEEAELAAEEPTAEEPTAEEPAADKPAADKPKRGRPRKAAAPEVEEPVGEPLTGLIVGVDLSPQTIAEMEAGRLALARARA